MSGADSDTKATDIERLRSDFDSLKQAFENLDAKVQRALSGNIIDLTKSNRRHRYEINDLRGKIEAIAAELDRRINAVIEEEPESESGYEPFASQSSTRSSVVAEVFDKLNKTKI